MSVRWSEDDNRKRLREKMNARDDKARARNNRTLQSMINNLISAQDDVTYYNVKMGMVEDLDKQDEYLKLLRKAQLARESLRDQLIRFIELMVETGIT